MKKFKFIIPTILVLAVLVFGFYWYEWRPTEIRKQCAVIQMHEDATPYVPAYIPTKTYEELKVGSRFDPNAMLESEPRAAREARPALDWTEPATPNEFSNCLHQHGL